MPPTLHEQRETTLAATFAPDPTMDVLESLRQNDPTAFARLSPVMKMQLGYWREARAAHAAVAAAAEEAKNSRTEKNPKGSTHHERR